MKRGGGWSTAGLADGSCDLAFVWLPGGCRRCARGRAARPKRSPGMG